MNTTKHSFIARVLSLILIFSIAPLPALANNPPEALDQQIEIDPLDKVIVWYPIGSNQAQPRGMGFGAWISTRWMIEHHVENILDLGVRRIQLHNPGGFKVETDGVMQFDQWLRAIDETPVATGDFVEQWKPIVDRDDIEEVIAYFGSPSSDPIQISLRENLPQWWGRAWLCIRPFIEAGMNIGIDASAPADPDEFTAHPIDRSRSDFIVTKWAQVIRWFGRRVYIEARPWNHNYVWATMPFQILDPFYVRSNPLFHADAAQRMFRDDEVLEEIVRLVRSGDQETENLDELKRRLMDGHTGTIHPRRLADKDEIKSDMPGILEFMNLANYPYWVVLKGEDLDDDELTFRIVSQPQNGTLEYLVPGEPKAKIKYTANPGFTGIDSFTYVANDGTQDSPPATVTLVVYSQLGERPVEAPPEDPPPAQIRKHRFVHNDRLFHPQRGEAVELIFDLVTDETVTLNVKTPWGSPVRTLLDNVDLSSGRNSVEWDGTDFAGNLTNAGFYLVELEIQGWDEPLISAVANNSDRLIQLPPVQGSDGSNEGQPGHQPTGFGLFRNVFNPDREESLEIEFNVNTLSSVSLKVRIPQSGEIIKTLLDTTVAGGPQAIFWNGRNDQGFIVSSGIYMLVLDVQGTEYTKKIAVLR